MQALLLTQQMANLHGYGFTVAVYSLHYTTWQFLTTQLYSCENLCLKYAADSCFSSTIPQVSYPTLGQLWVCLKHYEHMFLKFQYKCALCFIIGSTVNSALLVFADIPLQLSLAKPAVHCLIADIQLVSDITATGVQNKSTLGLSSVICCNKLLML